MGILRVVTKLYLEVVAFNIACEQVGGGALGRLRYKNRIIRTVSFVNLVSCHPNATHGILFHCSTSKF